MKKIFLIAVFFLALFQLPFPAQAVQVTGIGTSQDQALKNALQLAVESEIGALIKSDSLVQNYELVKDQIITHSQGFVENYTIVKTVNQPDGSSEVTINAQVSAGMIKDSAQALEVLMKMASHPKILILGSSQDVNSIPSNNTHFQGMIKNISAIFSNDFKFQVLSWKGLMKKIPSLTATPTLKQIMSHNQEINAEYVLTLELLYSTAKKENLTALLSSLRISDAKVISEKEILCGTINPSVAEKPAGIQKATSLADARIYPAATQVAYEMVSELQAETEFGHGTEYLIEFRDFKNPDTLVSFLTVIPGYVRHALKGQNSRVTLIKYWSNLDMDQLIYRINSELEGQNIKYKKRIDGRRIDYKWLNPDGF